jgi:hypothetical protein
MDKGNGKLDTNWLIAFTEMLSSLATVIIAIATTTVFLL